MFIIKTTMLLRTVIQIEIVRILPNIFIPLQEAKNKQTNKQKTNTQETCKGHIFKI